MSLRCRVCGSVIPGRYPTWLLTWILAVVTIFMLLVIPTIVGFSTIVGGLAIIIGIFAGLVVLYLFATAESSCQVCQVKGEEEQKK